MMKTKEEKEDKEKIEENSEEKNRLAASTPSLATLALAILALLAFSTQANAKLEPGALLEFSFSQTPAGETTLALSEFKAGLTEIPSYPEPSLKEFRITLTDARGAVLRSFWLSDPRYSYYDVVGANGTLSGGKQFKPNARFFVIVPLLEQAEYAIVSNAENEELVAVNLRTGKQVEEKEWKTITPSFEEKRELGLTEFAIAVAALLILAFVALGLTVFNKARKR